MCVLGGGGFRGSAVAFLEELDVAVVLFFISRKCFLKNDKSVCIRNTHFLCLSDYVFFLFFGLPVTSCTRHKNIFVIFLSSTDILRTAKQIRN